MIYRLTTKNCSISGFTKKIIDKNIQKLSHFLIHFQDDLPILSLVIRGNKRKNYYDGSITLQLPKKVLFASINGSNIDEAVLLGFERIKKELETYKGLHFNSNSKYYDHRSIKNINEIVKRK